MGNEHSKNKEPKKNGTVSGVHENGSVNGLSANIKSDAVEISVNGETIVQQNTEPFSLKVATESLEPDFTIIESDGKLADTPVISQIVETIKPKEEITKSKEDQKDVSLPATDPQPESSLRGEAAATVIIDVHQEDFEYLYPKAETSTQTDKKIESHISTQTGEDDDVKTTSTESPVEEVFIMEAPLNEEDLNESSFVIAEEVVEKTSLEELLDNQTAGIITEGVVMESIAYDNIMFRAELVQVTSDIKNYDLEEETVNGLEETVQEIAAKPESYPNESIIEDKIVAEENNIQETLLFEDFSSLPKVVADCVEAVFATASQSADFAAVSTSEPSADEVITEDNGEGAGDMSVAVVLIETTEPESHSVTFEAQEANGVPSPDEEAVTVGMETISEVVCEQRHPILAIKDMPVQELSVPLVMMLDEEVTTDDAVAVQDVPGICEQEKTDDQPEEEIIIVDNTLIINEEVQEDTLSFLDNEVTADSILEDTTTNENAEVGEDVIADVGPERTELTLVQDDAVLILDTAIDVLSQEFEYRAITFQELAVDNGILMEEEIITATTFVPLSGEQEASFAVPAEPVETVAEEMDEEAIEALSNEFEVVAVRVEYTEGEVAGVTSSVEHLEESDMVEEEAEVLAQAEGDETPKQISVILKEPVEENSSLETIAEEIRTEDVTVADYSLVTSEEEAPEIITQGETEEEPGNESSVNSTDSTLDSQIVSSSDMEALVIRLQSACISVVEESGEETEVLPQAESAETLEQIPVISEEPVEENPRPCEGDANIKVLENLLESVVEPISEKLEVMDNTVEEPVPSTDDAVESESCISVQGELVEENVTPAEVPTDSNQVISEEPVVESARLLEQQSKTSMLVVFRETFEDEVTEELMQETDHSGTVLVDIEKNSEDTSSDDALSECAEAVLETIVEEILTEDVAAECILVSSEEEAPETITQSDTEEETEDESSVNSRDSTPDSQRVSRTDMEALLYRLQSVCISVVEESAYSLSGLRLTARGYDITVTINVGPKDEEW